MATKKGKKGAAAAAALPMPLEGGFGRIVEEGGLQATTFFGMRLAVGVVRLRDVDGEDVYRVWVAPDLTTSDLYERLEDLGDLDDNDALDELDTLARDLERASAGAGSLHYDCGVAWPCGHQEQFAVENAVEVAAALDRAITDADKGRETKTSHDASRGPSDGRFRFSARPSQEWATVDKDRQKDPADSVYAGLPETQPFAVYADAGSGNHREIGLPLARAFATHIRRVGELHAEVTKTSAAPARRSSKKAGASKRGRRP